MFLILVIHIPNKPVTAKKESALCGFLFTLCNSSTWLSIWKKWCLEKGIVKDPA